MKKSICAIVCFSLALSLTACANGTMTNQGVDSNIEAPATPTKSDELNDKYDFYKGTVKDIVKTMKVSDGQADEIFQILVNCGLNQKPTYIIGSNGSYTVDFGKIGEGVTNLYVKVDDNGIVTEVKDGLTIVYPQTSETETKAEPETETEQEAETDTETGGSNSNELTVVPETRKTAIGKSDKEVSFFVSPEATTVYGDVTGNWRYSGFSESGIDITEYALDYYNKYFESDKEIHAVVNFANKTTTQISFSMGMLFVTVREYVDGEEHDAKLTFSGNVLQDFIVYTDNGDIEDISNG